MFDGWGELGLGKRDVESWEARTVEDEEKGVIATVEIHSSGRHGGKGVCTRCLIEDLYWIRE